MPLNPGSLIILFRDNVSFNQVQINLSKLSTAELCLSYTGIQIVCRLYTTKDARIRRESLVRLNSENPETE